MSLPGTGFLTTDRYLVVQAWDDWLAQITGISASQAVGQPLGELVPDLQERGMLARLQQVVTLGTVEVFTPHLHGPFIPCPVQTPSPHFELMQQRVTAAPLFRDDRVIGAIITIEDVTPALDRQLSLRTHLQSDDEQTRRQAAQALAQEGTPEAIQTLVEAFTDTSWHVRRAAVEALAHYGGEHLADSVLAELESNHDKLSVLSGTLGVLALTSADLHHSLIEFLRHPETDVRIYAAQALANQRAPEVIPALLQALDDPDPNVRYHAIESLGKLRARLAVDPLLDIAETRDFYLAYPALDALATIGDTRAATRVAALIDNDLLRPAVIGALLTLGDENAVQPLVAELNRARTPALPIAQALAAIAARYQQRFGEGEYIADLVRNALTPVGQRALLQALEEANPADQPVLVRVLSWLDDPAVARVLARLLGEPTTRDEIVETLVRQGRRMTPLLLRLLNDEDGEIRQAAVMALGRIGDPRTAPALTDLLDAEPELIPVVAGALAKIGSLEAFEALLAHIGHPNRAVRQSIVGALNSLGHPQMAQRVATLLEDDDPHVREAAVQIAGYFGYKECAEQLIAHCYDSDEAVRCTALEHLPLLDDPRALDILRQALESPSARERAAAVYGLTQLDSARVIPFLAQALEDEDQWVRFYAARGAGYLASPELFENLAHHAQHDPAIPVRLEAIGALGRIGGQRAVAALIPFTEAAEPDMARVAIEALGKIGLPEALPPLLAALQATRGERRLIVIEALSRHDEPQVVAALQRVAATDQTPFVIEAAVEALVRIGTGPAIAALIELTADPVRREACVNALSQLSLEQLDAVAEGLMHPVPDVRCAVIEALARMKSAPATERLSLALNDTQPEVRLAAVSALGRLGSYYGERDLLARLRVEPDETVRSAIAALVHR
ncbi:MAG: hypothetical protein Kow00106_06200 [Anaerolineae bacterium]